MNTMDLQVSGPEQIRAAFTTAITTAGEHLAELAGIAGVLGEAADRYEALQMTASTLGHLRDGAAAVTAAAAALGTAEERLQAALGDFNDRDGQVADAVTETGNLMQADGYTTTFDPTGSQEQEKPMTPEPTAPAAPRGTYNPDQPRAADGKWIKVGDELGYADGENVHATGQVVGAGPVPTNLALIDYPDDGVNQQGAFVEVATPKDGYNPVTGAEGGGSSYYPPQLGPDEAEAAAGRLEELAGMVESGYRPPKPTVHTRARQRIEMLMAEDRAASRDRIIVGDQDDFPLTTGQLLKLLNEAAPPLSAPQTRHAIRAHAAGAAGGEDGTLWLDMEPDAAGGMHIVVTAVEGTEDPDDDYNRQYTAQHTPETARELPGKLRAFAGAARHRKRQRSADPQHDREARTVTVRASQCQVIRGSRVTHRAAGRDR